MFDFEENIDLNYQMLSPLVESDGRIVYNRGISNDIYLFAKDGTFEKVVRLDFGSHNVPADELNDLSKFMESSGDYCYIASTPVFMKDAILFILNKNNELYTCVYDLKRGRSYLNSMANYSTRTVNLPFSVAGEDVIVSYFNADIYPGYEKDEALSDSVKEEIASGANVVCLYHVRK